LVKEELQGCRWRAASWYVEKTTQENKYNLQKKNLDNNNSASNLSKVSF
jgi:hypothetical protein